MIPTYTKEDLKKIKSVFILNVNDTWYNSIHKIMTKLISIQTYFYSYQVESDIFTHDGDMCYWVNNKDELRVMRFNGSYGLGFSGIQLHNINAIKITPNKKSELIDLYPHLLKYIHNKIGKVKNEIIWNPNYEYIPEHIVESLILKLIEDEKETLDT